MPGYFFLILIFSSSLTLAGQIDFNDMIEQTNKEAETIKPVQKVEKIDTTKKRKAIKFEAEDPQTITAQSSADLNHNETNQLAKQKAKKKKMMLEVDKLAEEVGKLEADE